MTTHHNTQHLQVHSPIRMDDIRTALMSAFHFNTSLTGQEQSRMNLRAQYIYDITQQEFDWFVTLTFRHKKTDHDEVVLLGKKLFDVLSAELFGKRSRNRVIHFSAIEQHTDGSYHIHALIKQPHPDSSLTSMEVKDLIKRKWYEVASTNLDMSSSGYDLEKSWFRPIHSGQLFEVAEYITKECYRYDNNIIYDLCCLTGRKVG